MTASRENIVECVSSLEEQLEYTISTILETANVLHYQTATGKRESESQKKFLYGLRKLKQNFDKQKLT